MSYIDMNQPWSYMYSPSRSHLPPPSLPDPSGSSQCTRFEHLSHAPHLGWWSVSPLIIYMFRCCSLRETAFLKGPFLKRDSLNTWSDYEKWCKIRMQTISPKVQLYKAQLFKLKDVLESEEYKPLIFFDGETDEGRGKILSCAASLQDQVRNSENCPLGFFPSPLHLNCLREVINEEINICTEFWIIQQTFRGWHSLLSLHSVETWKEKNAVSLPRIRGLSFSPLLKP